MHENAPADLCACPRTAAVKHAQTSAGSHIYLRFNLPASNTPQSTASRRGLKPFLRSTSSSKWCGGRVQQRWQCARHTHTPSHNTSKRVSDLATEHSLQTTNEHTRHVRTPCAFCGDSHSTKEKSRGWSWPTVTGAWPWSSKQRG